MPVCWFGTLQGAPWGCRLPAPPAAPLPSSHCVSPDMGARAAQAGHCCGESQGPGGHLLDVRRDRQLQSSPGTVQRPAWAVSQPQQHLQHPLAAVSPTAAPPSLSSLPAPAPGTHKRWGLSSPGNLSCPHLPQSSFIPEQIALLSAHGVRQPSFYPHRLAPSATRHPGDTASTPG